MTCIFWRTLKEIDISWLGKEEQEWIQLNLSWVLQDDKHKDQKNWRDNYV